MVHHANEPNERWFWGSAPKSKGRTLFAIIIMEKSDEHPQKLRAHVMYCVVVAKQLDAFDFYLTQLGKSF